MSYGPHPKPPKREKGPRKPMRRRSAKMEARYSGPDGRRALVERLLRTRAKCEACLRIAEHLMPETAPVMSETALRQAMGCKLRARDVHEVLARSAGGSILDEDNCITVCPVAHSWIGDHPREALAIGLRASRYAGRNACTSGTP